MRRLLLFISLLLFLFIILPLNVIYFYLNYAPDQKKVLSEIASRALKQPVQIERAHIQGWITNPVIVFDHIAIGAASKPLVLAHIEIHIAFWKSFLEKKWIIQKIVLDHLRLQINQTAAGRYTFSGLTQQALSSPEKNQFLRAFFSYSREIILAKSALSVCLQKQPCVLVNDANIRIKNLNNHSIQVIAGLKKIEWQHTTLPFVYINAQWAAPFEVWGTIDIPSLEKLYGEFRLNTRYGVVQLGNQQGQLTSKWRVANNQLQAVTTIKTALNTALKIAQQASLSISRGLNQVAAKGFVTCDIHTRFNLNKMLQPPVQQVQIHFQDNTIVFSKWHITLSHLTGDAKIVNNQFQADKLKAVIQHQPILISVKEKKNQGMDLFLQGDVNPSEIADENHFSFLKNLNQKIAFHAWMTIQNDMNTLPTIHLTIDQLNYLGQSWRNIYFEIMRKKMGWHIQINSNLISGGVFFPLNEYDLVQINLTHLALFLQGAKNGERADVVNPKKIPAVSLRIHQLIVNHHDNGDLSLITAKVPDGLLIQKLKLISPLIDFSATGKWFENNSLQQTMMRGVIKSSDLGKLLSQHQLSSRLKGGDFSSEFSLQWSGLPQAFSFKHSNGFVIFYLQKGVITQLDSDTQNNIMLGRLLNLFSMETISKLLTFNFSSLTKKGFEFNEIQGRFELHDGVLSTQHVDVDSNIAKITLSGTLSLDNQSNNLTMRVVPSISSGFSTVAGFVGGPVVGATTWVANKLFSHKIGEMAEMRYHISGTWQKPVVKEVGQ